MTVDMILKKQAHCLNVLDRPSCMPYLHIDIDKVDAMSLFFPV